MTKYGYGWSGARRKELLPARLRKVRRDC